MGKDAQADGKYCNCSDSNYLKESEKDSGRSCGWRMDIRHQELYSSLRPEQRIYEDMNSANCSVGKVTSITMCVPERLKHLHGQKLPGTPKYSVHLNFLVYA